MAESVLTQEQIFNQYPFKRGKLNGKGREYWQGQADKLVVERLVRASMLDQSSIIGALASHRLLEIARTESSDLFDEVLAERAASEVSVGRTLRDVLGDSKKRPSGPVR